MQHCAAETRAVLQNIITETKIRKRKKRRALIRQPAQGRKTALMKTETIEEIILQQSHRGMDLLQSELQPDFCREAAKKIYELPRGPILLTTGFYVAGHGESDGPAGTACLAQALVKLGFLPRIITDEVCRSFFEPLELAVEYWPMGSIPNIKDLARLSPVGILSIERCGRNDEGKYANMRGVDISENTAPLDEFFHLAAERGVFTLGVGDGGNEIGMGNVADAVRQKLSLNPCVVKVDQLVLASVSNWGAYGLTACLSVLAGRDLLPSPGWLQENLQRWADMGCVDGVNRLAEPTVDGYPLGVENQVFEQIRAWGLAQL